MRSGLAIRRGYSTFRPLFPQDLFFPSRQQDNGLKRKEVAMQCVRCHGRMVTDYFIDMENSGELWMPGWRCLVCGEVVDPLIMKHRLTQEKTPEVEEATTRRKRKVQPVAAAKH